MEAYYAWANDNASSLDFEDNEVSLGRAIETGKLIDPDFIGHYNGLTHVGDLVVPVFMATHQCYFCPEDEEIVCHRIIH